MRRSPAKSLTSTVASPPDTQIPASHRTAGMVIRTAHAVVLALRFTVLKSVIYEIADPLTGKLSGKY